MSSSLPSSLFSWSGVPVSLPATGRSLLLACVVLLPAIGSPTVAKPPVTKPSVAGLPLDELSVAQASDPGQQSIGLAPDSVGDRISGSAGCEVLWVRPVDAPITDGYRPPADPYGPGNRGLEFGTESGDPVVAVADGTVRFAGNVGNAKFVTVEQASGLRATYGFVEQVLVAAGERVDQGQTIAVAGPGFHLTARIGSGYRDPTPLLKETCYRVRLVPVPDEVATG